MKRISLVSFIWSFLRPRKLSLFVILLISLGWALDSTLWPYLLGKVIDTLTRYEADRASVWEALKFPVFLALALWISVDLGFRVQGRMLARFLPRLEADVRMAMFDHIQRHSPKYFNERFAGGLANKITDMTTQLTAVFTQVLWTFLPPAAACVLSLVFFFRISPLFAAILVVVLIVYAVICKAFTKKCQEYEHVHGEARSSLLGKIVDSLTNNFAVNLFFRFNQEKKYLSRLQKEEEEKNVEAKKYAERMRSYLALTFFLGGVSITGSMLYLWKQGGISTGEIVQTFNMTWNIIMLLWMAGIEIPVFFQSIGIMRQALSVMHDAQDVADVPGAKPLKIERGEIVFENVSFQYGGKQLFRDKNLHIQAGENVGIVGYSGSGKTTLANLILRFYLVDKGRILIDGQDIASATLESLRAHIALIPQDPILFHRTIEENIRYGRDGASKEEVIEAAKLAHCDEFIGKSEKGYDTMVGERGMKLSGGEKQRIAIARAMLSNAPILILDEATSALDSVTEQYIQDSLGHLMHKRTTIVIAHRLSTLAKMDRILVLEEGKIVEEGAPSALLEKGGRYADLWRMQAGGFLPSQEGAEEELESV